MLPFGVAPATPAAVAAVAVAVVAAAMGSVAKKIAKSGSVIESSLAPSN